MSMKKMRKLPDKGFSMDVWLGGVAARQLLFGVLTPPLTQLSFFLRSSSSTHRIGPEPRHDDDIV
jgi:hypothetical protein